MEIRFLIARTGAQQVAEDFVARDARGAILSSWYRAYYLLRPLIPGFVRRRLQSRLLKQKTSDDRGDDWYFPGDFLDSLVASVKDAEDALPIIHPWPGGARFGLVLTHDVETAAGLREVDQLARVEERLGLRSSWNLVPHKYPIDMGLVRDLQARGFEIGIHGYNHDGRLYASRRTFERRAAYINAALERYGAVGFRSPMVHRNLEWLQLLNVEYDASCFDVDPFQAMPGGVGGIWPFICGKFVELPYTLPQDHTLLIVLGADGPRAWERKLQYLVARSGMALMLTHPDYLNTPRRLDLYRKFLERALAEEGGWHALPREAARWWRQRDDSSIVQDAQSQFAIEGPAGAQGVVAKVMVDQECLRIEPLMGVDRSAATGCEPAPGRLAARPSKA